ncbi:GntR family transcriptional regulator [Oceanobacillus alkalisoli]|uniref:GntR family transcriptional regulator n=1 Tax=Oceanobacillus alkalisoli TaxID=2925113 RepID=UPI001EE42111|nr:GntR family transcriptional regulator [Oceanobacillus alkalisoli]MCG5102490.1 GntR family transcriptional regulator [Oceanobacillus alkalisoli]
MIVSVIKRENLSTRDFAYETIKKRIIELELEPGQKISEQEIASELEVSRTPVREAFLKLSQEGLLGIYPQIGTIVSKIDLDLVEEGRFLRENIEKAVVREACHVLDEEQLFKLESNIAMQELCLNKGSFHRLLELDDEFHRLIFEGCNKLRTWRTIRQMNSQFDRLRVLRLASNLEWDILVSQHKAILEFIKDKKEDDAENLIVSHLNLVNFEKRELKKEYPNYF